MNISLARTDNEIYACYPVMRELRPHIKEDKFLSRIRIQQSDGYKLAYIQDKDEVVAVAGFRLGTNLAWGHFLYVDDLVTFPEHRSKGYGKALLDWLKSYAKKGGCDQLHLDSGFQRKDAHRFYVREKITSEGYHFVEVLK